jgi:pantetheine-phosphate adenylyltransferase
MEPWRSQHPSAEVPGQTQPDSGQQPQRHAAQLRRALQLSQAAGQKGSSEQHQQRPPHVRLTLSFSMTHEVRTHGVTIGHAVIRARLSLAPNTVYAAAMDSHTHGTRALFPGSFDPVTLGHLDLVRRARAIFGQVTVLVAAHAEKRGLFSAEERCRLLREALGGLDGVEIAETRGLLVDACRQHDARVVVRGVRGGSDLEYEAQMAGTNRSMLPEMDTVFLTPAPELSFISSTLVRQIASMGGDVSQLVPANVAAALARHFS